MSYFRSGGIPAVLMTALVIMCCLALTSVLSSYRDFITSNSGEDFSASHGSYGNGEQCRKEALNILLDWAGRGANAAELNSAALTKAKKCWNQALVFYLSYPMDFGFGSHVIPFFASLWATNGALLELGCGWHSTPIAHRVSCMQQRYVLTTEAQYMWLKYFLFFKTKYHDLYYVSLNSSSPDVSSDVTVVRDWSDVGDQRQHWSCIFVDHAPNEQRKKEIERVRSTTDLVLVHDTEQRAQPFYQSEDVLQSFKYRTTFGQGWLEVHTDILSDTRGDLVNIVKILCQWGIELMKVLKTDDKV